MKIYIDGKQLDTYANSVSVKKTNNLWKFGKAEFERTQTISVPATNNNKALLDFSDEFRTQSDVARGYVECLTELDGVVKPARLYVSGYKGGEFSCIITFGKELEILDKKLSEVVDLGSVPIFAGQYAEDFDIKGAYDKDGNPIERVVVSNDFIVKNLNLDFLDKDAFYDGNLNIGVMVDISKDDILEKSKATNIAINRRYGGLSDGESRLLPAYTNVLNNPYLQSFKVIEKYDGVHLPNGELIPNVICQVVNNNLGNRINYYANVEYYQFPFDVDLYFGQGNDNTILYYDGLYELVGIKQRGISDTIVSAAPITGRKIRISAGTKFGIMSSDDIWLNYNPDGVGAVVVNGFFFDRSPISSFNIDINFPRLTNDMLPDITVFNFFQVIGAYTGKMLYFDGSKYTLTDLSNITNTPKEYNADIVAANSYEVKDKAFEFAQNNWIKSKSGIQYTWYGVQNVHLSDNKDLLTVPFDTGSNMIGVLHVADSLPAVGQILSKTLHVISFSRNANLVDILENTRQVKIKFRMPYIDFDDVAELDCFRYKGALLQWVDLTWSDGWCTATLQTV